MIPALVLGAMVGLQAHAAENKDFNYHVDRFADIEVLRYEVPGFKDLSLQQKKMLYYLSQAAQMGRDIIWDRERTLQPQRSAKPSRTSTQTTKETATARTSRLSRNT